MSPPRVASLLPSATEMVAAVGMADHLVGVSHECDWPPEVVGLPVLTSTRLRLSPSSSRIDRDVRELLREALAVYEVDTEALRAARPDVIVTQDLCDVCAVSLADVQRAVAETLSPGVRIVNLHPTRLAEIWEDLLAVGRALGRGAEAEAALAVLQQRVESVRLRAAARPHRPAVLCIEWLDPVMVAGTWGPELVELAGGVPLVTRAGQHAPTLQRDELAALDPAPEVVLVKPCGFKLERTLAEAAVLEALFEGLPWPALREGRVYLADGNAYFNRPGPRIADSLEILAACLHPEEFPELAERHARAWRRL